MLEQNRFFVVDAARRIFYARHEEAPVFTGPGEMQSELLTHALAQRMPMPYGVNGELLKLCQAAFEQPVFLRFTDKSMLDGQELFLHKLFGSTLEIVTCKDRPALRTMPDLVNEWVGRYPVVVGLEIIHTPVGRSLVYVESQYSQLGGPLYQTVLKRRENGSLLFDGYERVQIARWVERIEVF